jgi:hypothetical protein
MWAATASAIASPFSRRVSIWEASVFDVGILAMSDLKFGLDMAFERVSIYQPLVTILYVFHMYSIYIPYIFQASAIVFRLEKHSFVTKGPRLPSSGEIKRPRERDIGVPTQHASPAAGVANTGFWLPDNEGNIRTLLRIS